MAFIQKRTWNASRGRGCAWVVHWQGPTGKRKGKHFQSRRAAIAYLKLVNSMRADFPSPLGRGNGSLRFSSPLPTRKGSLGRAAIVDALKAAYPTLTPVTGEVIVHVLAEVPPAAAVADVDNLLKPVLDALAGIVYVNDTQVIECLVRKIPSTERRLLIKVWPLI